MRFAYARDGGPLLNWSGSTPPSPTRAGETRSLGSFYPTTRTSNALRRYGGRSAGHGGAAISYEHDRALGAFNIDVPRPGSPEVVDGYEHRGYETPEPGAATIHLGGYMPEGAARNYGQQFLGADAPVAPPVQAFDRSLIRKAAVIASAYHGVKRNHGSVLWGLLWAAAAYVAPLNGVSAVAIGAAQGFGKPK